MPHATSLQCASLQDEQQLLQLQINTSLGNEVEEVDQSNASLFLALELSLQHLLTPKGLRVFLLKIASKQPLLKASRIVQNWDQFWYFQL
jgi:hypothetical protein